MNNKIIINETCANIKSIGLKALKGRWKPAVLVMLIYFLMIQVPMTAFDMLSYPGSGLGAIYIMLVAGPLTYGLVLIFLQLYSKAAIDTGDIFAGFGNFIKTLGLYLWMSLWILLWALIPIAGIFFAIWASLRYSMSFYIMVENPNMSIRECLNESKRLMVNNVGAYFILALSFIGWILLTTIPNIILFISVMFFVDLRNELLVSILTIVGSVGMLWVMAYWAATSAAFYHILTGKIKADVYIVDKY